jgi:hypothetical protein
MDTLYGEKMTLPLKVEQALVLALRSEEAELEKERCPHMFVLVAA